MIKVIELEDYTRRENLKFHNIPESEEQGVNHSPKQVRVFIWGRKPDVSSGRLPFHVRYFEINIGDFFLLLYYIFFLLRHLMNILTRG